MSTQTGNYTSPLQCRHTLCSIHCSEIGPALPAGVAWGRLLPCPLEASTMSWAVGIVGRCRLCLPKQPNMALPCSAPGQAPSCGSQCSVLADPGWLSCLPQGLRAAGARGRQRPTTWQHWGSPNGRVTSRPCTMSKVSIMVGNFTHASLLDYTESTPSKGRAISHNRTA